MKIFRTTELLLAYRELGIYFTLVGCFGNDIDKPYLSLIITNDSWEIFLNSLWGPYTLDAKKFEIVFEGSDFTLIYGWGAEKNIAKAKEVYVSVGRDRLEASTYEAMIHAFLAVEDTPTLLLIRFSSCLVAATPAEPSATA